MSDAGGTEEQSIEDLNSRTNLMSLLNELAEHPEKIDEIRQRVEEVFSQTRTILILDMSGFTRATQSGDVISFLLMIHQMQQLALPPIHEHGGLLVRAEHDNLTCIFDDVPQAIEASRSIRDRLESANVILPTSRDLYVSIGIGHGEILNVDNEEIYGNEVNLASKLGEDIGTLGDILLTPSAYERISAMGIECSKESISVSGLELTYYTVQS